MIVLEIVMWCLLVDSCVDLVILQRSVVVCYRQKNTSVVLNAEVDGMSVDKNSCTALVSEEKF